jgi:hypothetical protein
MKKLHLTALLSVGLLLAALPVGAQDAADKPASKPTADGWLPLFDGKTLSGWTAMDRGRWHVNEEGAVVGEGPVGHLFSPNTYTNLEFKAEAKLNHSGNSGMYIRARVSLGFPRGYEAQVENTSPDPQKTGSLYGFSKVTEQLVQDDTWWTQQVIAVGNHIIILVNGKVVTDFIDQKNTHKAGHLALQQHNEGSVVMYRNLMVRPLPSDEKAAWEIVKKELPELDKSKDK